MAVDWKTNRDLMQKLYILFYGRPADPEGVKFWASLLPDNAKLDSPEVRELIKSFVNSEEAKARFGNTEMKYVVTRLILYGFSRDASVEEIASFKDKPIEDVIISLINTQNERDKLTLENKVKYSNAFLIILDPNEDGIPNDNNVSGNEFIVTYRGNRDAEAMASKLFFVTDKTKLNIEEIFKDIKQAIARTTDKIMSLERPLAEEKIKSILFSDTTDTGSNNSSTEENTGGTTNNSGSGSGTGESGGSGSGSGGSTGGSQTDTTAPTITEINVSESKWYKAGDSIEFTVKFSENVFVSTANGIPSIDFKIGLSSKSANYHSGSGTNTLVFRYTVENNLEDNNGISFISNEIKLNGGSIKDSAGNNAVVIFNPIDLSGIKVDSVAPFIINLALSETDNTGVVEDNITNKNTVNIQGEVSSDVNVVKLYKGSTEVANSGVDNGKFTFSNISLVPGDNEFTVKAIDKAGNIKESSITIIYDNQKPSLHPDSYLAITDKDESLSYSPGDEIDIKFSEPVTGFTIDDIQVSDGKTLGTGAQITKIGTVQGEYADVYRITLGSNTNITEGTKLTIPKDKVVDIANNNAENNIEVTLLPLSSGGSGSGNDVRQFVTHEVIKKVYLGSLNIEFTESFILEDTISTQGMEVYKDGEEPVSLPEQLVVSDTKTKATLTTDLSSANNWVLFKYDGNTGDIKTNSGSFYVYLPSINVAVAKEGNSVIDLTTHESTQKFGAVNDGFINLIFGSSGNNIIKINSSQVGTSSNSPVIIFGGEGTDTFELNLNDSGMLFANIMDVSENDVVKIGENSGSTYVFLNGDWIATNETENNSLYTYVKRNNLSPTKYNIDLSLAGGSKGWNIDIGRPNSYIKGSNYDDFITLPVVDSPVNIETNSGDDYVFVKLWVMDEQNNLVAKIDNIDGGEGNDNLILADDYYEEINARLNIISTDIDNQIIEYSINEGIDWINISGGTGSPVVKSIENINTSNINCRVDAVVKGGVINSIITGDGSDTIQVVDGNAPSMITINVGKGNNNIYLDNSGNNTRAFIEMLSFNNANPNEQTIISNFEQNDTLIMWHLSGIYDKDEQAPGIQHILVSDENSVNVSNKLVIVHGEYSSLNNKESIANLFGENKPLSLNNTGGEAVVITTFSDENKDRFFIWSILSDDNVVTVEEVKLVGITYLTEDYVDGYLTSNNFMISNII